MWQLVLSLLSIESFTAPGASPFSHSPFAIRSCSRLKTNPGSAVMAEGRAGAKALLHPLIRCRRINRPLSRHH